MPATPTVTSVGKKLVVQTSTVWGSDGDWVAGSWTTDASLYARRASVGIGQTVGSATVWRPVSTHVKPGANAVTSTTLGLDLVGKWVRILVEQTGGPWSINSVDYGLLWAGRVISAEVRQDDESGFCFVEFEAAGVLSVLDTCYPWNWNVSAQGAASTGVLPYTLPPVANEPRLAVGNAKDSATDNFWDLSSAGVAWTWDRLAAAVIESAQAALQVGGSYTGPAFTAVDLPASVSASAPIKISDQWGVASNSALASLLLIASQRVGVTLRADIDQSSGAVALKFNTVVGAEVSWDSGDQLLPASAERFTVNLGSAGTAVTRSGTPAATVSGGVSRFNLSVNASATFDEIYLAGGANWWACTLTYQATGAQLAKGWDAALETDWDAASDSEKSNGTLAPVFSRFVIRSDWDGAVYPSQGGGGAEDLPMTRATGSGEPFNGGWNGLLTTTGNSQWTKGHFRLTKTLPWQAGYNWDSQDPAAVDQTREMDQPQAYAYDGTTWYTLAEYAELEDVQIRVDDDGSIVIGPIAAAKKVQELLGTTGHILAFTVGIRHWIDLAVSWVNTTAPPADAKRVLVRECPRQSVRSIANGTIIRIGSTGNIVQRTAHTEIASDIPALESALRRMSAWYGTPAVDLSWSYEGIIVPLSTINAGQLVTSATIPYAVDGTTASVDVLNVVTQIQWDFSGDTPTTSYTTARMVNDIEARQ